MSVTVVKNLKDLGPEIASAAEHAAGLIASQKLTHGEIHDLLRQLALLSGMAGALRGMRVTQEMIHSVPQPGGRNG